MSSENWAAANKRNAARSTGPKTAAGKALASRNAVAHGLCSARPVLPCERAEDWDRHRAGVAASLRPAGVLEEALAERVAGCLWRLRRVVAYETALAVVNMDEAADGPAEPDDAASLIPVVTDATRLKKAEKKLASARDTRDAWADTAGAFEALLSGAADAVPLTGSAVEGVFADLNEAVPDPDNQCFDFDEPEFLTGLGVPPEYLMCSESWAGWTVGAVRRALAEAATELDVPAEFLLTRAREARAEWVAGKTTEIAELAGEVRQLRDRIETRRQRQVVRRALPDAPSLDKLTRYEAHLTRQMLQSLHTLERLQAARAGLPVAPPVALDVLVDGPPSAGG